MMKFTVSVPKADHESLATALEKIDHVKLNGDRRSGISNNTDKTALEFKVLQDDEIEVIVTANPRNVSKTLLKAKTEARIAELLS